MLASHVALFLLMPTLTLRSERDPFSIFSTLPVQIVLIPAVVTQRDTFEKSFVLRENVSKKKIPIRK